MGPAVSSVLNPSTMMSPACSGGQTNGFPHAGRQTEPMLEFALFMLFARIGWVGFTPKNSTAPTMNLAAPVRVTVMVPAPIGIWVNLYCSPRTAFLIGLVVTTNVSPCMNEKGRTGPTAGVKVASSTVGELVVLVLLICTLSSSSTLDPLPIVNGRVTVVCAVLQPHWSSVDLVADVPNVTCALADWLSRTSTATITAILMATQPITDIRAPNAFSKSARW